MVTALRGLGVVFPRLTLMTAGAAEVSRLLEMCADDAAVRRYGHRALLTGLMALAGAAPAGALGAADVAVLSRAERLALPPGPTHSDPRPGRTHQYCAHHWLRSAGDCRPRRIRFPDVCQLDHRHTQSAVSVQTGCPAIESNSKLSSAHEGVAHARPGAARCGGRRIEITTHGASSRKRLSFCKESLKTRRGTRQTLLLNYVVAQY